MEIKLNTKTEKNPFLVVAIVDFNAQPSSRRFNDKRNYEGTKIDCLTAEYDPKDVINKPTHLLSSMFWCDPAQLYFCLFRFLSNKALFYIHISIYPTLIKICHLKTY